MDRIDTSNKEVDLFGAGKHGFRDGDLSIAVNPTFLNAKWFNAAQEELVNIIEGAGVVPDGVVRTQVRQAIKRLCGGNVTTVNAANSPLVLTADHAGLVIMDATAGNISATLPAVNAMTSPIKFSFVRSDASANAATVTRAGADTFVGGGTGFSLVGQGDYRIIQGDAVTHWSTSSAPAARQMQSLTATVAAGALTLGVAGSTLEFRNAALTDGAPLSRTFGPLSLVVPSGATLGTIAATKSRLILVIIDNAGTPELAVVNLAGGNSLDETGVISSTAISAAADSANVFYSATARAGVSYRVAGLVDSTQAVAGTWASAASLIQGVGGQALAAMASLGYGQGWVNVTGSRFAGTTYYNLTGKPIFVCCSIGAAANTSVSLNCFVDGVSIVSAGGASSVGNGYFQGYFPVPPGSSYSATSAAGFANWSELR